MGKNPLLFVITGDTSASAMDSFLVAITNKSVLCHAAEWKVSLTRPAAGVGIRQAGFYSKFVIATRMSRVITQTTE